MTRRARAVGFGIGIVLILPVALAVWVLWPLPQGLAAPPRAPSLELLDRNGLVLRTARAGDGNLTRWLPLAEMDPQIIQAFIAMEDRRFYHHPGVDARAVARAARDNFAAGRVRSGASTISMQLARILRPSRRTVLGKLSQTLWALRLEWHLGKQAILEQYLNRVPLGQGTLGVPAAAAVYFDAAATRLSLGQAALLAGMAQAPSTDNPFVSPERARARRDAALRRIRELGYATTADAERAAREPMLPGDRRAPFLAAHFTTRVLAWADAAGRPLDGVWRTSLDLDLETVLEGEVRHTVEVLRERGVANAAAVVLDNATGEILAWVGSPDFWADSTGQVDMVISPRQPGSALKPFLYGLAFDHGITPATILADLPHTYATAVGPYRPRNYDRRFHGPVRAREALASSFNVPAVELTERFGAAALLQTLQRAGFASLDRSPEHYGLGLALGNGDVTLLELANAYRALANGGTWRPYRWHGKASAADSEPASQVMSPAAAALILDILTDPVARIAGFGTATPFDFAFPVGVKTGTSRHFTDNWAVGVTGQFTVAIWVGNASGQPMKQVGGLTGAGPLLHRAILAVAARHAPGQLRTPAQEGAVPLRVCRLSGLRAVGECPALVEWFMPGTEPVATCDWHRSGQVALPVEYADWAEQNGIVAPPSFARYAASGGLRIVSPQEGDVYRIPPASTRATRRSGSKVKVGWQCVGW